MESSLEYNKPASFTEMLSLKSEPPVLGTPAISINSSNTLDQTSTSSGIREFNKVSEEESYTGIGKRCDDRTFHLAEVFLDQNGYTVIGRLHMTGADGIKRCYYKAHSPLSFIVYIEIDTPSRVSFSKDDLTMTETLRGVELEIPSSVKRGSYQNAYGDVVTECNKGICKLSYNPASTGPLETQYTFTTKATDRFIKPTGSIRVYPLIKLAEIEADSAAVLGRIKEETIKSRADAVAKTKYELTQMMKEIKALDEIANTFVMTHSSTQTQIREKLAHASSERERLSGVLRETAHKADVAVTYNTHKKELDRVSDICDDFQNMTTAVVDIRSEVSKIKNALETNISTLKEFVEIINTPIEDKYY